MERSDITLNIMKKRLLSLDVLRGITVAGMILVNNGFATFRMERADAL